MKNWILGIVVFGASVCVAMIIEVILFIGKRRRFSNRRELSKEDLRRLFVGVRLRPEEIEIALACIARVTTLKVGTLRPSDRFDAELAPARGWEFDDSLQFLPELIRAEFGGTITAYDLKRSKTVEGLMKAIETVRREATETGAEGTATGRAGTV